PVVPSSKPLNQRRESTADCMGTSLNPRYPREPWAKSGKAAPNFRRAILEMICRFCRQISPCLWVGKPALATRKKLYEPKTAQRPPSADESVCQLVSDSNGVPQR